MGSGTFNRVDNYSFHTNNVGNYVGASMDRDGSITISDTRGTCRCVHASLGYIQTNKGGPEQQGEHIE